MSAKYHIVPNSGKPGVCDPKKTGICKYAENGQNPEHYDSQQEAEKAYEKIAAEKFGNISTLKNREAYVDLSSIDVLYHATFSSNLASIQKNGLGNRKSVNKNWDFSDDVLYFSADLECARDFCESAEDVDEETYDSGIEVFAIRKKDNAELFKKFNIDTNDQSGLSFTTNQVIDFSELVAEEDLDEEDLNSFPNPDGWDVLPNEELKIPSESLNTNHGEEDTVEYYKAAYDYYEGSPRIVSRTRVVYIFEDHVIKVPLTDEGEFSNGLEVNTSKLQHLPIAKSEFITINHNGKEIEVMKMEKVQPVNADYKRMPDWVYRVDCGQVGLTRNGELVAYDL